MELENQDIKCSKFQDTETIIRKAAAKIKEAKNTKERQYYAQDILLETEGLLACLNYDANNLECVNCYAILKEYLHEYGYLAKDEIKNIY